MAQKLNCIYRYKLWQLHSVVPNKTWESSEMLTWQNLSTVLSEMVLPYSLEVYL